MLFDFSQIPGPESYRLLIQAVLPRPIAWVLTDNGNGTHNLAPFSFFNAVCAEPPILAFSVARKDDDQPKDTWANLAERPSCVVHLPTVEMAWAVHVTGRSLPRGQSEVEAAGLHTEPVPGWPLPRVRGPRVAFWAERERILELGQESVGLILVQVRGLWVDDSAVRESGGKVRLDPLRLNPLARLGGGGYASLGPLLDLPR